MSDARINRPLAESPRTPAAGELPDRFADFRDHHRGATVLICGCGASLNELERPERFLTIGVNDVGRLFEPTYLVVVNPARNFSADRFRFVEQSRARVVFSQLPLPLRHSRLIRFRLGERGGTSFSDPEVLPFTRNSPYVALSLAIHMGARRIGLIGVDFADDHFFAETGRHVLNGQIDRINREYARLGRSSRRRGIDVVNLSRRSRLTAFPKIGLGELLAEPEPETRSFAAIRPRAPQTWRGNHEDRH